MTVLNTQQAVHSSRTSTTLTRTPTAAKDVFETILARAKRASDELHNQGNLNGARESSLRKIEQSNLVTELPDAETTDLKLTIGEPFATGRSTAVHYATIGIPNGRTVRNCVAKLFPLSTEETTSLQQLRRDGPPESIHSLERHVDRFILQGGARALWLPTHTGLRDSTAEGFGWRTIEYKGKYWLASTQERLPYTQHTLRKALQTSLIQLKGTMNMRLERLLVGSFAHATKSYAACLLSRLRAGCVDADTKPQNTGVMIDGSNGDQRYVSKIIDPGEAILIEQNNVAPFSEETNALVNQPLSSVYGGGFSPLYTQSRYLEAWTRVFGKRDTSPEVRQQLHYSRLSGNEGLSAVFTLIDDIFPIRPGDPTRSSSTFPNIIAARRYFHEQILPNQEAATHPALYAAYQDVIAAGLKLDAHGSVPTYQHSLQLLEAIEQRSDHLIEHYPLPEETLFDPTYNQQTQAHVTRNSAMLTVHFPETGANETVVRRPQDLPAAPPALFGVNNGNDTNGNKPYDGNGRTESMAMREITPFERIGEQITKLGSRVYKFLAPN